MNIFVLLKHVPDLVEELEIAADGVSLDSLWMRRILSEYDDHALEQALLLKEQHGGTVHALILDTRDVDETLYNALAKGADSVIKLTGEFGDAVTSRTAAHVFHAHLSSLAFDLVLTGVQAIDDLDGSVGGTLSHLLQLPYVGVVSGIRVEPEQCAAIVQKEFPGGRLAEIRLQLPAIVGIQSSEKPPRYVPIARIRQSMKAGTIGEASVPEFKGLAGAAVPLGETMLDGGSAYPGLRVKQLYKPEETGHAEILDGSPDTVADALIAILSNKGLLR